MIKATTIFVAIAALATLANAQVFGNGSDVQTQQRTPWSYFKLDAKKRISINFRDASIDQIVQFYSSQSGITIVKDPKLKDKVTIISAGEVSLDSAFEILSAQLDLMNFTLDTNQAHTLLMIKAREQRSDGGFGNMTPDQVQQMFQGNRQNSELRVYKIKYANASSVAQIVNDVFMEREQQNNPFQRLFGGFNRGNRGNRGRGGFQLSAGSFQFPSGAQDTGPSVRASSDDYSNAVIVNAPHDQQLEVEALIEEIDQQTDVPQVTKVYPLEFAFADDLVPTLQSVLAANETTGRGGQTSNTNNFFDRISRLQRGVTNGGSVVADDRTNSLIVTATDQNQQIVAQVIQQVDHEVQTVDTTFVFPLDNARADAVATLLNQAFGTQRGGTTNRNGTTTNRNTTNRNNTNNRNNNNRGNIGGGGGNRGGFGGGQPVQSDTAQDDPNAITLNFEDQDDQYGDLLTQVNVRNRLFGAQQNSQGNTTQARGSGGQIVNTRQAQGQVTIIPDPNTNSLIVVGDPENAEMIRNVLAQLDKIPEQVMIETIIVEATLDKSTKMGVEWNLVNGKFLNNSGVTGTGNTDFGLQTNPPAQGFRYTIAGGNIGAFLNALETDDKFRVLSTPRIFTSNNVQAEINISQSVPFIVSQREDANGNFTFNYSFQDVGIVLTVTPRITANGMVTLDVVQTANDLQGFTTFNAPIVNQRQAQTTVSVKDGDTIILGGIMRTQVRATTNKVPLLGDIPILGNLFKSVSRQNEKTELLVFLTPHVVRDPDEARKLKDDELKKLSPDSQKSYQQVRPPVKGGGTGGTTGGTGGTGGGTGGSGGN